MTSKKDVLQRLRQLADLDRLEGMSRYGMKVDKRWGVAVPEIRMMAKEIGKDHRLVLQLWKTGISEAMILASMVDLPEKVTPGQMEDWVKDLDSWDVCDQVCMNLFDRTPYARKMIREWAERKEEFIKRAAFALIASLAVHDRNSPDEDFLAFLPMIEKASADDRNFVKKAVSWALRNIGKRSRDLNQTALNFSEVLLKAETKSARWIASDAIRDLMSESTKRRIKKRS